MRPLVVLMLLGAAACSRSTPAQSPPSITVPADFQAKSVHSTTHPLARGTIRLGESEATTAEAPAPAGNAPTATGGGPPAQPPPVMTGPYGAPGGGPPANNKSASGTSDIAPIQGSQNTSVGPMSPSTVTGTKSPLDGSTQTPGSTNNGGSTQPK
jgi:hypothetical protein